MEKEKERLITFDGKSALLKNPKIDAQLSILNRQIWNVDCGEKMMSSYNAYVYLYMHYLVTPSIRIKNK